MFNNRGNHVVFPFLFQGVHGLLEPVVGLGASSGKDDFKRVGVQYVSNLFSCRFDGSLGLIAKAIEAGRVAILLG